VRVYGAAHIDPACSTRRTPAPFSGETHNNGGVPPSSDRLLHRDVLAAVATSLDASLVDAQPLQVEPTGNGVTR
jgi:hypothetical protein